MNRIATGSIPAWAGKPTSEQPSTISAPVYPRVGGETYQRTAQHDIGAGLSPRGRGNLLRGLLALGAARSIPAWAGKPRCPRGSGASPRVYPRVGGETPGSGRESGLSPRGRGNLDIFLPPVLGSGSIPAWAGKPDKHQ